MKKQDKELNLKVGQKLYQVAYWSGRAGSKRRLEYARIKKINPKTVDTGYMYGTRIKKSTIGTDWFLSKKEAIEDTIKLTEAKALEYKNYMKQVASLKKMLKRVKE